MFDVSTSYLREINSVPVLSTEEQLALGFAYRAGDRAAGDKLLRSHLKFALSMASAVGRRNRHLSLADLVQEANLAMLRALQKYEPERGFRFSTYAAWWIKSKLALFAVRNLSLVKFGKTQRERDFFDKFGAIMRRLEHESPNMSLGERFELAAEEIRATPEEIGEMYSRWCGDMSLNAPVSASEQTNSTFQDLLPSGEPTVEDLAISGEAKEKVRKAAYACARRPLEAWIVKFRLLAAPPMTLDEVGANFGLSRERVRQVEREVVKRMRKHLIAS